MTLARDIETLDPDVESKKDLWALEFKEHKSEIRLHCEKFHRVNDNIWMLILNTGESYIYNTRTRRMNVCNGNRGFFVQAAQVVSFILRKENKAFNKIKAARESRAKKLQTVREG